MRLRVSGSDPKLKPTDLLLQRAHLPGRPPRSAATSNSQIRRAQRVSYTDAPLPPQTHGIPATTLQFRSYHGPPAHIRLLRALRELHRLRARHAALQARAPPHAAAAVDGAPGPFVHKKSQENFEQRTHKRVVKAWDAHSDVVDMLVHKWRRVPVGVCQKTMESVVGYMPLDEQVRAEKVKALGEQIVHQELAAAAAGARDAVQKSQPKSLQSRTAVQHHHATRVDISSSVFQRMYQVRR